jgi:AcrR family transcriptional regulator
MGRAFTEFEKENIKEELLIEGRHAFEQMHFNAVKVETIAKTVGISKGAFYTFFDSKEAFFLEILMRFEADIQSQILNGKEQSESIKDYLIYSIVTLIEAMADNFLFISFSDAKVQQSLLAKATELQRERMLNADLALLSELIPDEKLLTVSRDEAVDLMRSLFFLLPMKSEIRTPFDQFLRTYTTLIIGGIFKDTEA